MPCAPLFKRSAVLPGIEIGSLRSGCQLGCVLMKAAFQREDVRAF